MPEGQIVRNKRTGQIGRLVNGQVVPVGPINSGVDPADVARQQSQNLNERKFSYEQSRDAVKDEKDRRDQQEKADKMIEAQRDAASSLERTIKKIDQIEKDVNDSWTGVGGLGETGWSGWMQGSLPGTAAYSLRKDLGTIDATQVLQAMTRLKELSPTGSTGFGALSAPELELLKSSVARLDPDMDQETFVKNLRDAKRVYSEMLGRIKSTKKSTPDDIQAIMQKYGN